MKTTRVIILVTALIGIVSCILSLREPSSTPKGKLLTGVSFGCIGLSHFLHGLELIREHKNAEE